MNNYRIGLVIPIFQSAFIKNVVRSILDTYAESDLLICIVNDGKPDVASFLSHHTWPENVSILNLPENRCFAGANNAGWKFLIEQAPQISYLGTINDDTIPRDEWLNILLNALENDNRLAMAGPVMETNRVCFGWDSSDIEGKLQYGRFKTGTIDEAWIPVKEKLTDDAFVPALSGFCFLARRTALEEAGFLDDKFCNYCEDFDLSLSLLTKGWRLKLCKDSIVFHLIGKSRAIHKATDGEKSNYLRLQSKWGWDFSRFNNLNENGFYAPDEKLVKKMRHAAHVLMFNCDRFILAMIDNCGPFVDKIYVAYSKLPWGYNPEAREKYRNTTPPSLLAKSRYFDKIEFIEGDWLYDHDQRNACLERARVDGFDYLIAQDADEYYTTEGYRNNLLEIARDPDREAYNAPLYAFWKTTDYILESPGGLPAVGFPAFAINLKKPVNFVNSRTVSASDTSRLPWPCYHLSYVLTDEELLRKISTWGHTHQFNRSKWYKNKWLRWHEGTINLHPLWPELWKRAVRFTGELPETLKTFNNPPLTIFKPSNIDIFFEKLDDAAYFIKSLAKLIRPAIARRLHKYLAFKISDK